MATITKRTWRRSNGTKGCAWIVSYSDQHKRRHIRTFPTKAEAEIWRREELRRVPIAVAEAGAAWHAQCEGDGLQAATIRQYRQHLDLHIGPVIGSRALVDRPRHIDVNYLAASRNLWEKTDAIDTASRPKNHVAEILAEAAAEMNRVLDQQPQLGAFGFGVYDQRQKTAAEGAWHPG